MNRWRVSALRTCASTALAGCVMLGLFIALAGLIAPRPSLPAFFLGQGGWPEATERIPREAETTPVIACCPGCDDAGIELHALAPPPARTAPQFGTIELDEPAPPHVAAPRFAEKFMCLPRKSIEPEYPPSALRRRIEGEVLVDVAIARSGSVQHAAVLHAEPAGVFDAAALRAVRRWRYEASDDSANASCDRARVRLRFELPRDAR
jgi:TonB family protein